MVMYWRKLGWSPRIAICIQMVKPSLGARKEKDEGDDEEENFVEGGEGRK